jgi:outer membrane protein assembly factor BamB
MLKKLFIVLIAISVVAGALFAAGYRIKLDGSGSMPRYVARTNYDALEADRARHQMSQPAQIEAPQAVQTAAAQTPAANAPAASATPSATAAVARGTNWTDFRGPNRDGRYTARPIRTSWPREGLPLLWKQPVGGGYASFVVADGRAFTIEQRREREVVAAYDVKSGRELWTNTWSANFQEGMGGDGTRATPTYHDGRN